MAKWHIGSTATAMEDGSGGYGHTASFGSGLAILIVSSYIFGPILSEMFFI